MLMNFKLQKLLLMALLLTSPLALPAAVLPTFVIPTDGIDCSFNGENVIDGSSVQAFQNSTVNFGNSCVSEKRLCTAGALSGSFAFASCAVGAPASCLFNGNTLLHGDSVTSYTSSTVAFGQVCSSVAETRICNNGVLSGSAAYAACDTAAARSCLFDGKTIAHGQFTLAYLNSSSQFGNTCSQENRVCNDGTLSGSYTFGSCTIDQPASCLFDGRTLAHGETAFAFQSSTSSFGVACTQENRTCSNGTLSGSFNFSSCAVNQPASCSLNGSTVTHGASVIAFESTNVTYGSSCNSQARSCSNGVLSGTFLNSACSVDAAANCTLNGNTVLNGASVTMFAASHVPAGQTCTSESRTCSNGTLSGSNVSASCVVDGIVVINPPPTCNFNGATIVSDATVKAYESASVPFGQTCISESRECLFGQLTGSFTNSSCSVQAAASCTLNGKLIANGSSVTVFTTSSVASGQACKSEVRTCSNGVLSGSAVAETCVVNNPPPQQPPVDPGTGQCKPTDLIWEFPKECRGNCGYGNGYFKSRVSRNNGKTWLTLQKNALPEDLKEIWNYMIKQNGKNSCGRPNVNYLASKNTGYVVLATSKIPDCKICRFVEVEQQREEHHGRCEKHKAKQKVLKFLCGEIIKKKYHGHKDHDGDDDRDRDRDHDDDHGRRKNHR